VAGHLFPLPQIVRDRRATRLSPPSPEQDRGENSAGAALPPPPT